MSENILVIKLGALGDFVQAAGPFAAIRDHHTGANVILLTSEPFTAFAHKAPWFDDTWADTRPRLWQIGGCLNLRAKLRSADFSRVYDLQTSDRSNFYYRLFWPGPYPEWSGIAKGCSHPHTNPQRDFMHTVERQKEQLAMAGIDNVPAPDFSWINSSGPGFDLSDRYALLAPGGAPHRPAKRWPREHYRELAAYFTGRDIQPVLIGGPDESSLLSEIAGHVPGAKNLAGQTALEDLFILARSAVAAAGNDTGPMHAIAAQACPTVVLYSDDSDPSLCAQRGNAVSILRQESLSHLPVSEVINEIENLLKK